MDANLLARALQTAQRLLTTAEGRVLDGAPWPDICEAMEDAIAALRGEGGDPVRAAAVVAVTRLVVEPAGYDSWRT